MKAIKIIFLFLTIVFYLGMGAMHIFKPDQYLVTIPSWLPFPTQLIYGSAIIEIILAISLTPKQPRTLASKLIITMLIIYLVVVHISPSITYYQTSNQDFIASLIRLAFQFILIYWASIFGEISFKKQQQCLILNN
ncbi:hypothetical protein ACEN2I_07235 [Flavobacterium sp. W22_SRS_FK3]|uniref:DoxX family protein n=1 Tax=Flavobacterium sp. W22_SRS_FK3 TaxID=3240275 RepID=UPI003F8F391A